MSTTQARNIIPIALALLLAGCEGMSLSTPFGTIEREESVGSIDPDGCMLGQTIMTPGSDLTLNCSSDEDTLETISEQTTDNAPPGEASPTHSVRPGGASLSGGLDGAFRRSGTLAGGIFNSPSTNSPDLPPSCEDMRPQVIPRMQVGYDRCDAIEAAEEKAAMVFSPKVFASLCPQRQDALVEICSQEDCGTYYGLVNAVIGGQWIQASMELLRHSNGYQDYPRLREIDGMRAEELAQWLRGGCDK